MYAPMTNKIITTHYTAEGIQWYDMKGCEVIMSANTHSHALGL